MPVNRNALIRYRTIDNCLRNRQRRWTLEDLIDACSEALYEYEGIDKGVSRRSIQMDLQLMRSDKLGYNAPIVVLEKKYYTYEDPEYSITNIPLTDQDLGKLTEVVEILRQFKGFSHFQELSGMIQRLENKIYSAKTNTEPVIDLEKNENLKGLEFIEPLYQAIMKKCSIVLHYRSFKARDVNSFDFHPYYLKEYRNRWFVIGLKKRNAELMNLALDRILQIEECQRPYIPKQKNFTLTDHLKDVIGVSVSPGARREKVILFADNATAPYIITKPLHHSQQVEETLSHGIIVSIQVQLNFELEREILGFGNRVRVIAPERLKRRVKECLEQALDQYQYELSESSLHSLIQRVHYKGSAVLHHVYSRKEINQMKLRLDNYFKTKAIEHTHALRNVLTEIPELKGLLLNGNLLNILKRINPKLFLTKVLFFDKSPESNWYVTWHQDIIIHVRDKVDAEGFSGWTKKHGAYGVCPPDEILKDTFAIRVHLDDTDETNGALKVIHGSQNKKLSGDEISMITQNSIPFICNVKSCGIHIMKPLLLHASAKSASQKSRRVIHLEFNSLELPNGLEWAERYNLE
ncbi:MAG TPA: WYL domain-containing protein [Ohtaekwangia sp.]